jgi:hypothetical protein
MRSGKYVRLIAESSLAVKLVELMNEPSVPFAPIAVRATSKKVYTYSFIYKFVKRQSTSRCRFQTPGVDLVTPIALPGHSGPSSAQVALLAPSAARTPPTVHTISWRLRTHEYYAPLSKACRLYVWHERTSRSMRLLRTESQKLEIASVRMKRVNSAFR